MGSLLGEELLRLPVRHKGVRLGLPVDLILDAAGEWVLGVDVLCGGDVHRFLPLRAAAVLSGEIAVDSALTLLADPEGAFYRKRGATLRTLRGASVERGAEHGTLRDLVVGPDGEVEGLVVEIGGERVRRPRAGSALRAA